MGANTFSNTAIAKTANEAFGQLVEAARYEHGHGGYTGTIAEKHDFCLLTLPPKMKPYVFINAVIGGSDLVYRKTYDPKTWAERDLTEREFKALLKKWKVKPEQVPAIERAFKAVDDKWGPAGCVDITDTKEGREYRKARRRRKPNRVFAFFGWASS